MFDKLKNWLNKAWNEKTVDKALKQLADYQDDKIPSGKKGEDLLKIAATIKKNPKLVQEKGFGYLQDFAEHYPKNQQAIGSSEKVSKIITKCIIARASESQSDPAERLQAITEDIASGKARSLSQARTNVAFVLTTNIGLMINNDESGVKRVKGGLNRGLTDSGLSVEDAEKLTDQIARRYPPIAGVVGKGDSLKAMEQDMITIIGNGSQGMEGQKNQAARYVELQKFEKGVKDQFLGYVKAGTIDTPEVQQYLTEKSLQAAEHLRADYATGLDRGRKQEDITKQLGRIDQAKEFVKTGVKATTIGPKVVEAVSKIVEERPSVSSPPSKSSTVSVSSRKTVSGDRSI